LRVPIARSRVRSCRAPVAGRASTARFQ
jgi:hypothetical protein